MAGHRQAYGGRISWYVGNEDALRQLQALLEYYETEGGFIQPEDGNIWNVFGGTYFMVTTFTSTFATLATMINQRLYVSSCFLS